MKKIISVFTIVLLVVAISTSVFAEGESIIGRTFTLTEEGQGTMEITVMDESNLAIHVIFADGTTGELSGTYILEGDVITVNVAGGELGKANIVGNTFVPIDVPVISGDIEEEVPTEDMTEPSESKLSAMIEKLTSSTFWVTMATVLSVVVACIALLKNKLGVIVNLIKNKADTAAISSALENNVSAISNAFKAEIAKIEQKLSETEKTEKQLLTVISIFMSNAKINPNTRSEIMKILTGIKEVSGELTEIIEETNQAIAEANAAEEPAETPALTAIENEIIMG